MAEESETPEKPESDAGTLSRPLCEPDALQELIYDGDEANEDVLTTSSLVPPETEILVGFEANVESTLLHLGKCVAVDTSGEDMEDSDYSTDGPDLLEQRQPEYAPPAARANGGIVRRFRSHCSSHRNFLFNH